MSNDLELTKKCIKCLYIKEINVFYKHTTSSDGYRNVCKTCNLTQMKSYKIKNANKILEYKKKYVKNRSATDVNFKILQKLRKRLNRYVKSKSNTTKDLLGCSTNELRLHLESQFYDRKDGSKMSWSNYNLKGWHIDHIIPLERFNLTDPEELKKACCHINLQPLWAEDNFAKGDK